MRFLKTALVGLAALVATATPSKALEARFGDGGISYDPGSGYLFFPFEVENDDTGTQYKESTLNFLKGDSTVLTSGLLGVYTHSTNWASLADMINGTTTNGQDLVSTDLDDGDFPVYDGWVITQNTNGSVTLSEINPLFAEDWVDNTNPKNYIAKGFRLVHSSMYDGNGDTSDFTLDYNAASIGDAIPFINTNGMTNSANATIGSGAIAYADGNFLDLRIKSVPEYEVDVIATTNGTSSPTNAIVKQGDSTNITHTANQYYFVDNTVHVFGDTTSTNYYGTGSNSVVETLSTVQTNGTISADYSPEVTTTEQLPHWRIAQYYGHTNNFDNLEGTDTDEDGLNLEAEFLYNLNPTVPDYFADEGVFIIHTK